MVNDKPLPEGHGGGVAAVYRKDIKITTILTPADHSYEHPAFRLSAPTPLVTAIIYHPPKPNVSFLSEFSHFLTKLCATSPSVLHLGDFNIHIEDNDCKCATEFLELLQYFNFTQHINFPTHRDFQYVQPHASYRAPSAHYQYFTISPTSLT